MVTETSEPSKPIAGLVGFALGTVALMTVLIHFWAGPFAPQKSISTSVGEIAAEIRQAATRALAGEPQPDPAPAAWHADRIVRTLGAALAGLATVCGLLGFVLREPRRLAAGAVALGLGAIAFQLFTWMVLLIAGVFVLIAIIENIDGILGS